MGQLLGRQKSKGLCAICLEKMPMKSISALRCGHLFHFRCIKYWLTEQETCPECRKPSKLDDIVTSLYFHDDMDDRRKSDITDTHSDEDSLSEFEKSNNYNDLLRKLDNAYLELKSEKALHEQTKEFLEKVQWEKLELITSNKIYSENFENIYLKNAKTFAKLFKNFNDKSANILDKYNSDNDWK